MRGRDICHFCERRIVGAKIHLITGRYAVSFGTGSPAKSRLAGDIGGCVCRRNQNGNIGQQGCDIGADEHIHVVACAYRTGLQGEVVVTATQRTEVDDIFIPGIGCGKGDVCSELSPGKSVCGIHHLQNAVGASTTGPELQGAAIHDGKQRRRKQIFGAGGTVFVGTCCSIPGISGAAGPGSLPSHRWVGSVLKALKQSIFAHGSAAQSHIIVGSIVYHAQDSAMCTNGGGIVANRNRAAGISTEIEGQVYSIQLKHGCIRADNAHVCIGQVQVSATIIDNGYILISRSCIDANGVKVHGIRSVDEGGSGRDIFQAEVVYTKAIDGGRRSVLVEGQIEGLSGIIAQAESVLRPFCIITVDESQLGGKGSDIRGRGGNIDPVGVDPGGAFHLVPPDRPYIVARADGGRDQPVVCISHSMRSIWLRMCGRDILA